MTEENMRSFWSETAEVCNKEGFPAAFNKVRRAVKEELRVLLRIKKATVKQSALAKKYCIGRGLEIGGSAVTPFNLNTLNVDYTDEMTVFKKAEFRDGFKCMPVDIVAQGDNIPLPDGSQDFIVSSHVLEHFFDPIKTLVEWHRLVKNGGIIFMIIPHKQRTFDTDRERTKLKELIDRHNGKIREVESPHNHHSVWITEDLIELVFYMNDEKLFPQPAFLEAVQDVDDKAGNGFTIILKK
jgi:SAM-dependent methyltransferase